MEDNKNLNQLQDKPMLPTQLVNDVKQIVERGIRDAYDKVNTVAILTYWQIDAVSLRKSNTVIAGLNMAPG